MLRELEELSLHTNQLSGPIPASLAWLSALRSLRLSGNPGLTGCVPPSLRDIGTNDLADLALPDCPPSAPSPCESGTAVANPADNPALVLDCTILLGLRDTLAGDATLNWDPATRMWRWDGVVRGGWPQRVWALNLSRRSLSGRIPLELGRLAGLHSLRLDDNQLSGPIPATLGALRNLTNLSLSRNQLTGPIPAALASLRDLGDLGLRGNRLNGPIPPWLGSMSTLWRLELSENQLTGPIPAALGALADLKHLDLRDNQLSGPIPREVRLLDRTEKLYLGGNPGLTGCLPSVLRAVAHNDLAGLSLPDCPPPPAPAQACVNGAAVAEAADNPGLVSDCAILLTALYVLRGDALLNWDPATPITEWDGVTVNGESPRVTKLQLSGRPLTGSIPTKLGGLTALRELHLAHTRLSGAIPEQLGDLATLRSLRLDGNQLTGSIPPELGAPVKSAVPESESQPTQRPDPAGASRAQRPTDSVAAL